MAVTVASTTDTQEQVNAALGIAQTEPEPKQPAAETTSEANSSETATEGEQVETAPDSETGESEQKTEGDDGQRPVRGKGGFQKKINKLTSRNYELENTVEKQSEQIKELLARLDGNKTSATEQKTDKAAAAEDPEPDPDKFDTYEKYIKALTSWQVRQEKRTQEEASRKEQEAQHQKTENERLKSVFDNYNRSVAEARGEYDDFDEVVGASKLQVTRAVQLAVIELGDASVTYYLAKNPDVVEHLNSLSDVSAMVEVGKLVARLSAGEEKTPSRTASTVKPPTKAPAPIKPVGGSATKSAVSLGDPKLSYKDYKKLRKAGVTS